MPDYSQQASLHRAALLLGLATGADVIAWADDILEHGGEPSKLLIDLTLVSPNDLSELRHALEPIASREDSPAMFRALFDMARQRVVAGERSVEDTITVLTQARSFLKLPDAYAADIQTLHTDHLLAVAGIRGNVAEAENRVIEWLAQFENAADAFLQETTHG
jgi:hypothetical protein